MSLSRGFNHPRVQPLFADIVLLLFILPAPIHYSLLPFHFLSWFYYTKKQLPAREAVLRTFYKIFMLLQEPTKHTYDGVVVVKKFQNQTAVEEFGDCRGRNQRQDRHHKADNKNPFDKTNRHTQDTVQLIQQTDFFGKFGEELTQDEYDNFEQKEQYNTRNQRGEQFTKGCANQGSKRCAFRDIYAYILFRNQRRDDG